MGKPLELTVTIRDETTNRSVNGETAVTVRIRVVTATPANITWSQLKDYIMRHAVRGENGPKILRDPVLGDIESATGSFKDIIQQAAVLLNTYGVSVSRGGGERFALSTDVGLRLLEVS